MDVQKVISNALGLAMLATLAAPAFALGQAPNDDFADRETVGSLPFTDTETAIDSSTSEAGDPVLACAAFPGENTVWYSYTASPFSVEYLNVSTQGSDYDTVLAVYEGTAPSPASLVAGGCNDDYNGPGQSQVAGVRLKPDTTYSIEVARQPPPFPLPPPTLSLSITASPVYQVSTIADLGNDGVCDSVCSLREAISASNTSPGAVLVPAGTYHSTLIGADNANALGDFDITIGMGIYGAGRNQTIISGEEGDRMLHIDPGGLGIISLAVTGVTLQNGHAVGDGGAVLVPARDNFIDFDRVSIEDSVATGDGGGMSLASEGRLMRSTVVGNSAFGGGGGLSLADGRTSETFEVRDSTINGNASLGAAAGGGGIQTLRELTVVNSTIHGNIAYFSGGGIYARTSDPGLGCPDCVRRLRSTTVSGNTADFNDDNVGAGGGVRFDDTFSEVVTNSVIADNLDNNSAAFHDCSEGGGVAPAITHSLVESPAGGCNLAGAGMISGTDPALGALADNGGPVPTQGFEVPSPLLDAGQTVAATDSFGVLLPFDQRGPGFPRVIDGDADGVVEVDIGAFEHVADLAPSCPPASGSTAEDQPLPVNLNCTDPEGRPIAYGAATALHGSVTGTGASRTYTPDQDYNGPDTISYTASDGVTVPVNRSVTVSVTPVPDAPAASADSRTTAAGQRLVIPAPGVLANDTDADGDGVTADLVSQPANGSLQLAADGGFTYTPRAGFSGTDTFTYRAADATSFSPPATVTLTVTPNPLADTDPPETTITKPKRSKRRSVTVELAADELGSRFECQLDEKPFSPCSSPARIRAKAGKHTLLVRAIDKAGNADATPAQATFRVRKGPPR